MIKTQILLRKTIEGNRRFRLGLGFFYFILNLPPLTHDVTCSRPLCPDFTWVEEIWADNVRWIPSTFCLIFLSFACYNFLNKCLGQTFCCILHGSKDSYEDLHFVVRFIRKRMQIYQASNTLLLSCNQLQNKNTHINCFIFNLQQMQ